MSIYGQIIILLARYGAIHTWMNESTITNILLKVAKHNNKYTAKSSYSTHKLTIKLSFFLNVPWPPEQSVVPQKFQTW